MLLVVVAAFKLQNLIDVTKGNKQVNILYCAPLLETRRGLRKSYLLAPGSLAPRERASIECVLRAGPKKRKHTHTHEKCKESLYASDAEFRFQVRPLLGSECVDFSHAKNKLRKKRLPKSLWELKAYTVRSAYIRLP